MSQEYPHIDDPDDILYCSRCGSYLTDWEVENDIRAYACGSIFRGYSKKGLIITSACAWGSVRVAFQELRKACASSLKRGYRKLIASFTPGGRKIEGMDAFDNCTDCSYK